MLTTWRRRACLLCWSSRDGCGTFTQTFRIVDDFATELQGAIRRCQVFRFGFDLMRAYNGNCVKAALMTTKDEMNKCGKRRFRGRPFTVDSPEKNEAGFEVEGIRANVGVGSSVQIDSKWKLDSPVSSASSRFCQMLGQPREWTCYKKRDTIEIQKMYAKQTSTDH